MTLEALFARVLGLPVESIDDSIGTETHRQWDSVKHMELVTAIEKSFNVKLTTRDIYTMKTFGDAKAFLQKRGVL